MSEENKAREFWLKIKQFENVGMGGFRYADCEVSVDKDCMYNYDDFKNAIHTIEYQAYSQAQAEIEKLKKHNGILRGALEHYESAHYDFGNRECSHDKTATDALKKVDGME